MGMRIILEVIEVGVFDKRGNESDGLRIQGFRH
jgi:hypothetical protein